MTKNRKPKREARRRSKAAWFDAGTSAFERVFPGARARAFPEFKNPYICPLCRRPFANVGLADGTLTFEDAPPKSYGGKPVALTCKPCNNSFGSSGGIARALRQPVRQSLHDCHRRGRGKRVPGTSEGAQEFHHPTESERSKGDRPLQHGPRHKGSRGVGQSPPYAEMGSSEAASRRRRLAEVRVHGGVRHVGLHVRVRTRAEDCAASAGAVPRSHHSALEADECHAGFSTFVAPTNSKASPCGWGSTSYCYRPTGAT